VAAVPALDYATPTEDAGQEATAAVAARAAGLGLATGLLKLGLQLLVLLVQALDRRFLNQDRLGHVIRRRRLLAQVLLDPRLCLCITWLAWVLGLLETAEQAIDQGLFFSVHGATSWEAGHRTCPRWGAWAADSITCGVKLFSANDRSGLKLCPAFTAMRC